ncbi:MAG: hypothetical protein EPO35_05795 [Acidobacteria bacterium]|nr:MAG: hypothetical protein EPO35_05795 [Acidobacteriota bacterium]
MWFALVALAGAASVTVAGSQTGAMPKDGRALVERMHAAYAGRWFRTLTFAQKTTIVRPDESRVEQTWFESMRSPDLLRIDVAPLSDGNGSLNKPDSVVVVRGGKVTTTRPAGNPFLPFVVGIYTQPVDQSIAQLAAERYDMSLVRASEFLGRKVFVVGSKSDDDLTSPQFWVDAERLVAVRAILPSGANMLDITLDGYIQSGASWVATKVSMMVGGKLRQLEEYTEVRTDVELPADLFDPARWMTAKHWAAGR